MNTSGKFNSVESTAPARRLVASVRIDDENRRSSQGGRHLLRAHFTSLTDTQASLLSEVLPELTSVMDAIKQEAWEENGRAIDHAFKLSRPVIEQYNREAWSHERWHESYLQQTSHLSLSDAKERCTQSPWNAFDDLLVLSHRGSRYVPLFLFSAEGPPDPWWVTVIAALRHKRWSDPWSLLAWLVTPQMLLQGRSPFESLRDIPEHVVSLAQSATQQDEL